MIKDYNGVSGTFIRDSGKELKLTKEKVKKLLSNPDYKERPYKIDYKKVLLEYRRLDAIYGENRGTIEEFLTNYCWGIFMNKPFMDSQILREAYYLDLKKYLNELDIKGSLVK